MNATVRPLVALLCCLLVSAALYAQNTRFKGMYPLAAPAENIIELKAEWDYLLPAIAGGIRMIEKPNTPSKKADPEAFTKADFKAHTEAIADYALQVATKIAAIQKDPWEKRVVEMQQVQKDLKSAKYKAVVDWLATQQVQGSDQMEEQFLICHDYVVDKQVNAPWTRAENLETTRLFRSVIDYTAKNFDRPYGLQAEQGAVSANAAQSLSNCMEFPQNLSWNGEKEISFKKDDELRQLAGTIVFYEWRLYQPVNGLRAAAINRTHVRNVKNALYEVVARMKRNQKDWHKEKGLGDVIQQLYRDALENGWTLDGQRAIRRSESKPTATDFYQAHTGRTAF